MLLFFFIKTHISRKPQDNNFKYLQCFMFKYLIESSFSNNTNFNYYLLSEIVLCIETIFKSLQVYEMTDLSKCQNGKWKGLLLQIHFILIKSKKRNLRNHINQNLSRSVCGALIHFGYKN